MVAWLERLFPGLRGTVYRITSPPTDKCNCVAWAVGVTADWWCPVGHPGKHIHWPVGAPREETIEAFRAAFSLVGFVPCDSEQLEPGFEKLALFADAQQTPTHAARQLPAGHWTSKLGQEHDIEHDLRAPEGDLYSKVALVLKRPLPSTSPSA